MKDRHFNVPSTKTLRQRLRHSVPRAEQILWRKIRRRQIAGYKFRRQHAIDSFVVDFYCPELRLAVEIDGTSHFGSRAVERYDHKRQIHIESQNIRVVRFTNDEIYFRLGDVIDYLHELTASTPPNPPLSRGGETR